MAAAHQAGKAGRLRDLLDCLAGNVLDVAAADAEVIQFAVGHAAEFVAGLTVLAPIVERASNVHDAGPFQGSLPAPSAGPHLMIGI